MKINRSALARKRILAIISTALFLLIAIDFVLLSNYKRPAFKMEPADAEIRLLGIEPDARGVIFDPNGQKLYEGIIIDSLNSFGGRPSSRPGSPQPPPQIDRTFIFEIPKDNAQNPDSFTLMIRNPADEKSFFARMGWGGQQFTNFNDKRIFGVQVGIPKVQTRYLYKKYIPLKRNVDNVDIILQYFSGQRGNARITIAGPFTLGQTIEHKGEPNYMLTVLKDNPFPQEKSDVQFELIVSISSNQQPVLGKIDQKIFIYDISGNRYRPSPRSMRRIGSSNVYKYVLILRGVSLDSIAYITINEKPKEIIYRNVPLYFSE